MAKVLKADDTTFVHQRIDVENQKYISTFVYVHDDTFGREFACLADLIAYLKPSVFKFRVTVMSMSKDGINIFCLDVLTDDPVDCIAELETLNQKCDYLNGMKYYMGQPCLYTKDTDLSPWI